MDNVIGHSYGTTFEVTAGGNLQPKKKKEEPTSGTLLWMYEVDALSWRVRNLSNPFNSKGIAHPIAKEI